MIPCILYYITFFLYLNLKAWHLEKLETRKKTNMSWGDNLRGRNRLTNCQCSAYEICHITCCRTDHKHPVGLRSVQHSSGPSLWNSSPLFCLTWLWFCILTSCRRSANMFSYRARKNGLQNIVKNDPGMANQRSQGTAGRNFTKPRTSHFFGLCMRWNNFSPDFTQPGKSL